MNLRSLKELTNISCQFLKIKWRHHKPDDRGGHLKTPPVLRLNDEFNLDLKIDKLMNRSVYLSSESASRERSQIMSQTQHLCLLLLVIIAL